MELVGRNLRFAEESMVGFAGKEVELTNGD
jgi:hypothetical protein